MHQTFRVPTSPLIVILYYTTVVMVAGAAAWSFRAGYMWTGICLLAVALPMGILYWYMLIINPGRARIDVSEEGLLIHAPPFLETAVPRESIQRTFDVALGKTDVFGLKKKPKKGMKFGSYRSGLFETESGREAIILANRTAALCLDTGERYIVLGIKNLPALKQALGA